MKNRLTYFVVGFVLCAALLHFCNSRKVNDTVITKVKVVKVTDTIKLNGKVVTKFKNVYVKKTDTSLVYVDKPDSTTVEARIYTQPIISKRSKGVATITTTGELLDFCAVIESNDSIVEKTIIKHRDNSKLFLSGEISSSKDLKIGIDWNIKNKVLLKAGVGANLGTSTPYISVGIGIPIFWVPLQIKFNLI